MGIYIDRVGKTYGYLTVLEKLDTKPKIKWRCRCECGRFKSASGNQLRQGKIKSCGCLHANIEESGARYGNLTILERVENSAAGKVRYLCKCDCGTLCEVVSADLRNGNQISCGCIKSKGEAKIISLLCNNGVNFFKEVSFDTCYDERPLPFDFKIENEDGIYLIEYDGKQHFSAEHAWSTFLFERTQRHDEIKNQWCRDNGIPLIRIPYTHYDKLNIEDLKLETTTFRVV